METVEEMLESVGLEAGTPSADLYCLLSKRGVRDDDNTVTFEYDEIESRIGLSKPQAQGAWAQLMNRRLVADARGIDTIVGSLEGEVQGSQFVLTDNVSTLLMTTPERWPQDGVWRQIGEAALGTAVSG